MWFRCTLLLLMCMIADIFWTLIYELMVPINSVRARACVFCRYGLYLPDGMLSMRNLWKTSVSWMIWQSVLHTVYKVTYIRTRLLIWLPVWERWNRCHRNMCQLFINCRIISWNGKRPTLTILQLTGHFGITEFMALSMCITKRALIRLLRKT